MGLVDDGTCGFVGIDAGDSPGDSNVDFGWKYLSSGGTVWLGIRKHVAFLGWGKVNV